jgi:hypothetical protein
MLKNVDRCFDCWRLLARKSYRQYRSGAKRTNLSENARDFIHPCIENSNDLRSMPTRAKSRVFSKYVLQFTLMADGRSDHYMEKRSFYLMVSTMASRLNIYLYVRYRNASPRRAARCHKIRNPNCDVSLSSRCYPSYLLRTTLPCLQRTMRISNTKDGFGTKQCLDGCRFFLLVVFDTDRNSNRRCSTVHWRHDASSVLAASHS